MKQPFKIPRDYAVLPMFQILRAIERMGGTGGRDPLEWWAELRPASQSLLLAYEQIRRAQDSQHGE